MLMGVRRKGRWNVDKRDLQSSVLNVDFVVAIQDRQRMKLGERHAPHPKRTHYSACGLVDDNIYTARRFAPDEGFDVCQRGIFEV